MEENMISPSYKMDLAIKINKTLDKRWKDIDCKYAFFKDWQKKTSYTKIDSCGIEVPQYQFDVSVYDNNWISFIMRIPEEILLRIAIDLSIETPDFLPSIPTFRNELKHTSQTARQTFDDAFKMAMEKPADAIRDCYSALESIIKEMRSISEVKEAIKDERIKDNDSIRELIKQICKAFKSKCDMPEFADLCNHLSAISKDIEDIRSKYTKAHGRTDKDVIPEDSIYAYFMINTVTTLGMFLQSFYKKNFKKEEKKESPKNQWNTNLLEK